MTNEPDPTRPPEQPSLRRELRAILTLYLVVSLLPLALGWLLRPR